MKVYFDVGQYPEVLEKCSTNFSDSRGNILNRDIEYIECDTNRIVLEDYIDHEDFQMLLDNWDVLICYIIQLIEEELEKYFPEFDSPYRIDVLEHAFEVEGLK